MWSRPAGPSVRLVPIFFPKGQNWLFFFQRTPLQIVRSFKFCCIDCTKQSYDGGRMPLFLLDTAALYQLQKAETIWNSTLSGDDNAQIPVTSGCSMWHNAAWYCRFASSWHLDHATCWCFISCVLHSGLMQLETLVLWRHALKSPWMTQGTTGLLPSKFQPILTLRLMV